MATGKQGFVRATEPQHSVSVRGENETHVQAPLPAMYIQAVSGLPSYPQAQPAGAQDAAVIPLSVPMMYANQTLPFLTLHIASGAGLQQQRPEPPASSPRPKSSGKHVCPHCGRDCLKPSVLEKHLRCHTGERPYPCATCGISFKTQSNLYKHKRTQAHARLSSESGKGTFSSQESTESSRENCTSPSLELQNEDSGDTNRNDAVLPTVTRSTGSSEEVKTGSDTEWALCKAAVVGVIASPAHGQKVISHTICQRVPQLSSDAAPLQAKSPKGEGRTPLTPNRTPLQRQEALFPKSQSHDSTDSGFSESNEQHSTSSPGATVHNSSMDLEEPETSEKLSDVGTDDIKSKVSLQEKQKLEKHILKLISENSVVMDDKHLVNVRPRKTVLSKQGSIDLPMPYTYKDSFHFEIRSSKHQVSSSQKQDRNGRAFYSSMPTQHSTSLEHAPLTRSSSLPFSVGIQNSDSTVSPYRVDSVPLSRRCSAGHIYPIKSVDQHIPSHRSLVRQVAVDGLSAVEASPMERGNLSSFSSDGDYTDTTSESAIKRCRRKKAKKFAFNKWYMYGGGTFKKICNIEKDSALKTRKSTLSPEQTDSQGIQISHQKDINSSASVCVSYTSSSAPTLSPVASVLTGQTSSQVLSSYVLVQNTPKKQSSGQPQPSLTKQTFQAQDMCTVNAIKDTEEKGRAPETQLSSPIPSERKKQKTDEHLSTLVENTEALIRMQQRESRQVNANLCHSLQSECGDVPQKSSLTPLQRDKGLSLNRQGSFTNLSSSPNQRQILFKRHSSPHFVANLSGTSASPSASSSISSVSQAKTSFLPKYQLKIPVLTDGMSDPCLGKGSSLNPSSPRQNVSLNQQSATTSPSAPQNQSTMTVMSPGQEQGTLCLTAITKATSMTSAVYGCQNANAYTSACTSPTSVSLASPLAFSDLSVTVNKIHSSVSSVSHSSTSTKNSQVYAGNVASVQDNPVTCVVIPTQSSGVTPAPGPPSSTDGIPLEISSTEIQGSQDTFYMQTADLQIVMQLISDEQLALIEPQIETQDYKTTGSFLSKDPETSGTDRTQTGVSQEIHKQCSGDTGTKLAVEQENANRSMLSTIPDITLMSAGSTVTDHKAKNIKSAQDVYVTNPGAKGFISRSPSTLEHNISAFQDSSGLGQQCKLLSSTPEESMLPKDPEAVGCGVSDRSYLQQKSSEKLGKPSADQCSAKSESEVSKSSAHDQILRKYPTSIICSIHQSYQDATGSHGTIPTMVASTNNTATSSEGKSGKVNITTFPEISERSPNHQSVQTTVQQHKILTKTVEKQTAETNTSCISAASSVQGLPLTPISASTQHEPIHPRSCQPSARAIISRSGLACRVSPQQPLNRTGACSENRSKHEENQTSASGQSGQHLVRECRSKPEEVKAITFRTSHRTSAQDGSHGSGSHNLKEENMKSALGPGGMLHGNQESYTGPPVSCSLQSLNFQWEAGTGRQKCIPLEPESGEADGTERVGTWDKKREEDAAENKREQDAKCSESYHIAVKPHPDLSTSQHMTNVNTVLPEHVSISTTPSACGISNPSQESKWLTNRDRVRENSPGAKVAPKLIDQSSTKAKEHVLLGHCEKFTSLSRGPGDMRHLLAHPLSVNAIQKEVQKDTQTKSSARQLTHSPSSQAQRQLPERETDGTTRVSVLNEPCTTSPGNTEHCQIIKTTPAYTRPSCSTQTNSSCIHPNPTCTSNIHSTPTEPNAPHSYTEEEEEEEERSSSSDDEGKLVIELE